jgi:type VI secretion system protein ImpB
MAVQDEVPKSRLTLRYKTEVNGAPADIDLPLRMLVVGDFSQGTSSDRKVELEERKLRSLDGKNTNTVMKDMKMSCKFEVSNKVDPDQSEKLDVAIPIESMRSFSPEEIAKHIPKVRSLMLLKKLLLEVEANVANVKDFRKMVTDLYGSEADFNAVKEQLKGFDGFKIPGAK